MLILGLLFIFFFFNDTATTEIYTLSLHDALPISSAARSTINGRRATRSRPRSGPTGTAGCPAPRSEEHTSELQSRSDLVCRLLLEKKKKHIHVNQHLVDDMEVRRHRHKRRDGCEQ